MYVYTSYNTWLPSLSYHHNMHYIVASMCKVDLSLTSYHHLTYYYAAVLLIILTGYCSGIKIVFLLLLAGLLLSLLLTQCMMLC